MRDDDLKTQQLNLKPLPSKDGCNESDAGGGETADQESDQESDEEGDDGSHDAEITDILAFEEQRIRSWKRRSNALLAALRRHHPEHDPRRSQPRGGSEKEPRGVSGNQPRGVSGKSRRGIGGENLRAAPLRPIADTAMQAAHEGLERRTTEGHARHLGAPGAEPAADAAKPVNGEPRLPGFEIARIKRAACLYYGFSLTELVSPRRQANLARARQVAMYIAKVTTSRSFPEIGRHFGDRDHTTVLHAVKKIEADLDSYRDEIAAVCAALR